MNKFFGFEGKDSSHNTLFLFGFKIRMLKKEIRNVDSEYLVIDDITKIPPAQGALRKVQLGNLALLKMFDKVAKNNNLRYWIDFGTLLGAVRHKGFIPWDDDIDLGMPRSDYERVCEVFKDDPNLYVCEFSNGRNKCYIKIKHKKLDTVFLDIFPYDLYHSKTNEDEKKKLHAKIQKIAKKLKLSWFRENNTEKLKYKLQKITKGKIQENKECLEENQPSLFWGIDFPHTWKNRVYDWESIFPISEIQFEGSVFPAPNNSDLVLKNIYGDYMQPPSNRYPRHSYVKGYDDEKSKILDSIIKEGNK